MANWVLLISATAYLTWVIGHTEGPFNLFAKLRGLPWTFGEMAQCYWCTSLWVALINIALFLYIPALIWVLALAGFVNALRTVYQHVSLPRENKIRIDTAEFIQKNFSKSYAAKYLELGDMQEAFKAVNAEDE